MTRPVSWVVSNIVPLTLTAALVVVLADLLIWRAG